MGPNDSHPIIPRALTPLLYTIYNILIKKAPGFQGFGAFYGLILCLKRGLLGYLARQLWLAPWDLRLYSRVAWKPCGSYSWGRPGPGSRCLDKAGEPPGIFEDVILYVVRLVVLLWVYYVCTL